MTRKESIFREAALLFSEKGYSASSMRDLAERVGIEPSSLYSHIKSKEEILKEICMSCAQDFVDGIKSIDNKDRDALAKVEALVRLHLSITAENPNSIIVFNDEWKHLDTNSLNLFKALRQEYETIFKSILKEGQESGQIRTGSSGIMMNSVISALSWVHQVDGRSSKNYDLSDEMVAFVLASIKS